MAVSLVTGCLKYACVYVCLHVSCIGRIWLKYYSLSCNLSKIFLANSAAGLVFSWRKHSFRDYRFLCGCVRVDIQHVCVVLYIYSFFFPRSTVRIRTKSFTLNLTNLSLTFFPHPRPNGQNEPRAKQTFMMSTRSMIIPGNWWNHRVGDSVLFCVFNKRM